MNPTKIEWLHWPDGKPGYSWNPIQGLCPQDCWYCYARRIYKRFKRPKKLSFDPDYKFYPKKPSRIFVCSTMEIFHPQVKPEWRDWIFYEIKKHTKHIFFILTKRPELIDRPMPENIWLGVTVTKLDDYLKKVELFRHKAKRYFISYEPILAPLPPVFPVGANWLIMGRLTGHGNRRNPELNLLKDFRQECKELHIPLFMKNNLDPIWPGKLAQEFPKWT